MTYYINPWWIYLMNITGGLKIAFIIIAIISAFSTLFTFVYFMINVSFEDDNTKIKKALIPSAIILILTSFLSIAIPSKDTCIEMMIASQVTKENVQIVKEEVYEIIDYVTEKIDGDE